MEGFTIVNNEIIKVPKKLLDAIINAYKEERRWKYFFFLAFIIVTCLAHYGIYANDKNCQQTDQNYSELQSNYSELQSNYSKLQSDYKDLENVHQKLKNELCNAGVKKFCDMLTNVEVHICSPEGERICKEFHGAEICVTHYCNPEDGTFIEPSYVVYHYNYSSENNSIEMNLSGPNYSRSDKITPSVG